MITAAVTVLVAGFAMSIGYIWGSREATEACTKFLEEELV